jgi:hypothetical protein
MGPGVNDRFRIEVIHGGHEPILESLLGCDADMAQDGSCELGKEALDQVQPGAMSWGEPSIFILHLLWFDAKVLMPSRL